MNDPLEHHDFEKRLKKAAGDFFPEPSNRVWENVRDELHPRRRTYLLAIAASILLLLAVSFYFLQRQYFHSSKFTLAEQTSPAQSDNNHPANHLNKNQATPSELLSGKNATENQKNKESVLRGSASRSQTNHSNNSSLKEDLRGNNRTNYTFNKEKINKSDNPDSRPFFINKNTENEQSPELNIQSQNAEITGLPYLKSLTAKLNSPSLSEMAPFESFLFQDANHINNIPLMTSQEKEKFSTNKKHKVVSHRNPTFEIFYTPSLGYRTLAKGSSGATTTSSSLFGQFTSSSFSSKLKQQPEWSWSAGARIIFPFGRSWSLQTGLSAAEMNYRISAYGAYPVYIQNSSSYYAASPARPVSFLTMYALGAARPSITYLHNSYMTTEIPLMINKQFGNPHGVTFNIGAGAGLSYLFHSTPVIYSPFSGNYFTDRRYIRPVNGDFLFETSILIPLNTHLKLDIGPSFQYQILSSYKNYPAVKEHPYLIGLKTGLQWGR